jgi:hypothetical protein
MVERNLGTVAVLYCWKPATRAVRELPVGQ